MKTKLGVCAAVLFALVTTTVALTGVAPSRVDRIRSVLTDVDQDGVIIVAHRGHHLTAPENTVAAIEDAADVGAHMVEIDVRKTKDGAYVLMHDPTINRTTYQKGKVESLKLEEITSLTIRDDQRPTAHHPPSFVEAMEAARGRIMVNVDLKSGSVREVVGIARELGVVDHCLFKAKWEDVKKGDNRWLARQDDVLFMPIVNSVEEANEAIEAMSPVAIEYIQPLTEVLSVRDRRQFTIWERKGVRVWVNTLWNGRLAWGYADSDAVVDPGPVFEPLVEHGVSIIQTDLPEMAVEALAHLGSRFDSDHSAHAAAADTED